MNGLSLFSGAGIGELALKYIFPDYQTVGYVEWDKYCQAIIRARIKDGILDDAPIFGDIRHFNAAYASLYAGKVDWLSAGFPCQPFSVAGRRAGEADERNMWPATRDAIRIMRPQYVFLENVSGLISHKYIHRIFGDLAEMWYDCEWDIVGAADVGAPHRRKRLWIVAYVGSTERQQSGDSRSGWNGLTNSGSDVPDSECSRQLQSQGVESNKRRRIGNGSEDVADTTSSRPSRSRRSQYASNPAANGKGEGNNPLNDCQWSVEPDVGRVVNGLASRMDRLKALGNGWVPQVVRSILNVKK